MKQLPNLLVSSALVAAQFLICTALVGQLAWRQVSHEAWYLASPLWIAGSLLGLWAWLSIGWRRLRIFPEPGPRAQLVQSGPYSRLRHPMYSGLLAAMLGCVVMSPQLLNWLLWFGLWGTLELKATREERLLAALYPCYRAYQQRTGKFLPRLAGRPSTSADAD